MVILIKCCCQNFSQIWERLRGGRDGSDRRTTICPSGLHPSGTCACESIVNADESGAHVSISRIVMLAEALFEVFRSPLIMLSTYQKKKTKPLVMF